MARLFNSAVMALMNTPPRHAAPAPMLQRMTPRRDTETRAIGREQAKTRQDENKTERAAREAGRKAKHDADRAAREAKKISRKSLKAEKQTIKRKLVSNEMHGLFDFVAQGFSVVKDLAPAAIKANVQKRIAATQAKTAERIANIGNTAAPAAAASAAPMYYAPAPVAAPAPAMDWQKPALIGGGLLAAALILPRLLPQGGR